MSNGRSAAKALLLLACGYATGCAEEAEMAEETESPELIEEFTITDDGVPDEEDFAAATSVPVAAGQGENCLEGITNYQSAGPFRTSRRTSGRVKFTVPAVPAGCKVPVVHLANGTGASCSMYQAALTRLASHGFLAACYENTNTGAGAYGIEAFETAFRVFPDLADKKLGSTGHSQGGQASLVTLQLAEAKFGPDYVYAGLAMEPASGFGRKPAGQTWKQSYSKIKSPVFMFSGNSGLGYANSSLLGQSRGDGLVAISWVTEGFNALDKSIEAYHWTADGATHIPVPNKAEQEISIPWFRWKLLGDKAACEFFKQMPGSRWKPVNQQNPASCE